MIDLTLRADSEKAMRAALLAAGLWDATTDQPNPASHQHALDVAGTHYAQDGTVTDAKTGQQVPNMQPIKGYWAYLKVAESRPDIAKSLSAYIVDPLATTLRTWSGFNGPDTSRKYDAKADAFVTVTDRVVAKSAVETVSGKVLVAAVDAVADVAKDEPVAEAIEAKE